MVLELCGMDIAIFVCKLSAQCSGVIKSSARDALSRIKREYPPRAKMSWPLPVTATEELLEWPLAAPVNVAPSNC